MSIKAFRLLDSERAYLEEGEAPAGYRNHEMEERINEKIDLLDKRIKRILTDVELLSESDEWSVESWRDAWFRLIDADSTGMDLKGSYQYDIGDSTELEDGEYVRGSSLVSRLGEQFGNLMNTLLIYHQDIAQERVQADLVWGFCMGVSSESFPNNYEFASHTGELIQERAREEAEYFQDTLFDFKLFEGLQERHELVQRRIREVLDDQFEADVPDWAVNDIEQGLKEDRGEMWYASLDGSQEAMNDALSCKKIMDVYADMAVEEKAEVISVFESNADVLESVERDGLTAEDVLIEISPIQGKMVSEDLEEEKYSSRKLRDVAGSLAGPEKSPAVAKISRLLAAVDKIDGTSWDGPPLILLNENKEKLFDWSVEITKFGELFAYFVYDPDDPSKPIVTGLDPVGPAEPENIRAAHYELMKYQNG